jgi:N6-adenosine-specific RNA methylase IME4
LKAHLIAKDDFLRKIAVHLWFSNKHLTNSRRCRWSVDLSSFVSWILYTCRCRSFVRVRCMVHLGMSNCCERWRIDVPGHSATLSLTTAMLSTDRRLQWRTGNLLSIIEPVS